MASVWIHYSSTFAFLQFPFSFGVWCHFCPSRVMPRDPDTICKNGAQVSHRCLSFSPVYHFSDGHGPISDRSFISSCWQPLMILVIKKGQCQQPQFFPTILFLGRVWIFFRPLDNNVGVTFGSHYMITEYVLTSELVQVATWLSQHLVQRCLHQSFHTFIRPCAHHHNMLDHRTGDPARFV